MQLQRKKHVWKRRLLLIGAIILIGLVSLNVPVSETEASTTAQNVILFVGDGMGLEQVKAGAMYVTGTGTLNFEDFPNKTTMTHNNATDGLTDSAASATAMATGFKVNNGVISVWLPGDGSELRTQIEVYKTYGRSTGVISTSYITDATPAGFGAHETSRNNKSAIFSDFVNQTQPNVILGGGGSSYGYSATAAQNQGYTTISTRTELLALDTESISRVAAGFGSGELPPAGTPGRSTSLPTLPEMTETALNILDNDSDGFFLLVEHEGSDTYSHSNNTEGLVRSVAELSEAVQKALDWQASHPNTLIVVLADHETGGMTVTETTPQVGEVPSADWSTTGHTKTAVPVYAFGVGADQITGAQIDNTDIFELLKPDSGLPTATPTTQVPPTETPDIPPTATPVLPPTGSIDSRIEQGSDDVEELLSDGEMYLNSSDLELGDDMDYFGAQTLGLRFNDLAIPVDATITSAYIEFEADETDTESTSVTFRAQAADNAPAFGSAAYDLTNRTLTSAAVDWSNISSWNTVSQKHQSPDLAAVVQEVTGRPGWEQNNSIVFVVSGTGRRVAESYDGEAANAPLLHIEYATEAPPTATPDTPTNTPEPPTSTPVTPTNTPDPAITISFQNDLLPDEYYDGNKDTTLNEANPAVNYASADILIDGDDPPSAGTDLSALFRWDISAIPPGSIVQEASVTLNVFNVSPDTYQVYEIKRDWFEGQATWLQYQSGESWATAGAMGGLDRGSDTIATLTANSTGAHVISLNGDGLALVQKWINEPGNNNGFIIANSTETDGLDIYSSETATLANRPKLSVRYLAGPTPTPSPTPTETNTPVPPPTETNTPVPPPTETNTPVPPPTETNTPVPPPTETNTPVPPPTETNTPVPPPTETNTPVPPPTETNTPVPPPTETNTPVPPPTETNTPVPPPTATNTPAPSSGPKLVQGQVNNVGSSGWTTVTLPDSYNSMVIVASVNYGSGTAPGVARIRNAAGNQFEIRIDVANGSDVISGVTAHYTVMEEGVYSEAAHGVKAEAVRYQSTVTDHDASWVGESRSYANQYQSPVVVGQVMSYEDAAWSVFWARGTSKAGPPTASALYTGKHVAEDSSITRATETIGYLVFEAGSGSVDGVDYVAGVGGDTVLGFDDSPPYTYSFTPLQNAASAIVSQVGMDGGNGGWPVLYGANPLSNNAVDLAVDEDQFKDSERNHTTEQVSYLIFGEAMPVNGGPHLTTGVVSNVSTNGWTTVPLGRSFDSMVVVASINYDAAQTPMVARVRSVSDDSFDVRIDRADTSIAPISGITVHYVVVEEGLYTTADHGVKMEAVRYSSTVTDAKGSWLGQARSYMNSYTNPVVLGQVMSDNDAAWSVFWARGSSATNPPNGSLYVGKQVGEDSDQTRSDETVGYIVIEAGSGTIDGRAYLAALGNDTVKGMTNSPPFPYALNGLSSASVAVVSTAGMDGNNGGWPLLYGSTPLSASALQLAFDEDIIGDSERSHTTEQVAFIVFE